MKENFNTFFEKVLEVEGGYVNDPDDMGGCTNYGITFKTFQEYNLKAHGLNTYPVDLEEISLEEVSEIYHDAYWSRMWANELPSGIDIMITDFAVNSGITRASRVLQKAVGAKTDGFIGPKTLTLVSSHNMPKLLEDIYRLRRAFYGEIRWVQNNNKFFKGWINRLNKVYDVSFKLL
jgi:lysozyme family protein